MGLLVPAFWSLATEAKASQLPPWIVHEVPVSVKSGDQLNPDTDGTVVVYKDLGSEPEGRLVVRNPLAGDEIAMFSPGITAGPGADAGLVAWQTRDLQICLGELSGSASRCLDLPPAAALSLSGELAVTSHDNTVIRLVNFGTMRSRILDSSTSSGGRYDPDIEGNRAVWVKERGYAGRYYEPLIVSYDLSTDSATYLTNIGGGSTPDGESIYERRYPSLSGGRVLYQQRLRDDGGQWDIYEAVAGTYGIPVLEAPGDQIRPSLSGNLVVYQDNRSGQLNADGEWTGEWDIYLMDLEKGLEMPVCIAAGDQVNPVVRGNLIVWEDNRDGDWDVYAAALSPAVETPRLGLATSAVFWESFAHYQARELTVRFLIRNSGAGAASDVAFRHMMVTPSEVAVTRSMPDPVALLVAGESAPMEVWFHVPVGVGRFRTGVYASCRDAEGREIWFPGQPLV